MRDHSIDYIKGIAVILMLLVHPLMMMTNYKESPIQGLLAALGYFLTQPIAGLFVFALGYAMGMKKRSVSSVLNRSLYTLFIALTFGYFVDLISTGSFLFSVLFIAVIVCLSVGLILSIYKNQRALIAMGSLMVLTCLIPFMLEVFPQHQIIAGMLTFPLEKELMNFWVWDTPVLPYLVPGLFGGMLAIVNTSTSNNRLTPYLFLIISLIISLYAENISHITLPHTVITIGLCLLYPALLQYCRSIKIKTDSMVLLFGRNVTFIYFFHHLLLAGICILLVNTSFSYTSYYLLDEGASVLNPYLIVGTIGFLIIASRYASILIERIELKKMI